MTEVAKTYGEALYELATKEGCSQELLEQMEVLAAAFGEQPDFLKLLSSPALHKEERLAVLDKSFGEQLQPYLLNFLKILLERGSVGEFGGCYAAYKERYNEENGIEEVRAVTALPLSETLFEQLKEKLQQITGKTIRLQNVVDPAVLGGVRLELRGKQLEGTVQHQLESLRRSLTQMTL